MYKDYKVNEKIIESTLLLKEKHPTLVPPFSEAIEECMRLEYDRYIEHSYSNDETKLDELCIKLAVAISETAASLGHDFVYVPFRIHYKIRHANVTRPVQTVNFLKPLMD